MNALCHSRQHSAVVVGTAALLGRMPRRTREKTQIEVVAVRPNEHHDHYRETPSSAPRACKSRMTTSPP